MIAPAETMQALWSLVSAILTKDRLWFEIPHSNFVNYQRHLNLVYRVGTSKIDLNPTLVYY